MNKEAFPLDDFEKESGAVNEAVNEPEVPQTPEKPAEPLTDAEPAGDAAQAEGDVRKEMEDLRDLFQKTLDETAQEPPIQPLDDYEEETEDAEDEEIPEEDRCTCCGERRRNTEYGEDYPYCDECRGLMLANPIRFSAVLSVLLVFVVAALSLYFCTESAEDYLQLFDAHTAYQEGKLSDAMMYYTQYFSSKLSGEKVSMTAVKQLSDLEMKFGYPDHAGSLIETYMSDFEQKLPWNRKYTAYLSEMEQFNTAMKAVRELISTELATGKLDNYEAKDKELQALLLETDEDGQPKYNPLYVEYFRGVVMELAKRSEKELLQQFRAIEALDTDGTHPWLYMTSILSLAVRTGDAETAKTYYDKCIAFNKQEMQAYREYANLYRYTKNPDPDEMLKIAETAKENACVGEAPEYEMIFSVAYLLKEDNQAAMQAIETYINALYSSQQQATVRPFNLYALCAAVCGDEAAYKDMQQLFASSGMEISANVQKVKDGKMTVKQALTDIGGDIG